MSVTIPITETAKVTDTLSMAAFVADSELCAIEMDFSLSGLRRKADGYGQTEIIQSKACKQTDFLLTQQAPKSNNTFLARLMGISAGGESFHA